MRSGIDSGQYIEGDEVGFARPCNLHRCRSFNAVSRVSRVIVGITALVGVGGMIASVTSAIHWYAVDTENRSGLSGEYAPRSGVVT